MRLTMRLLGVEVLHISNDPDTAYDPASDLSGGTTGIASEVYAGNTDRYMGFTNGREDD
jgi:hypothetical protein